jgi:hypothetical protein
VHHMLLHHKDVLDEVFPARIVKLIQGDQEDVDAVPAGETKASPVTVKKMQITPLSHLKVCPVNDPRILKLQKRRLSNDGSQTAPSPAKKKQKTVHFASEVRASDVRPAVQKPPVYANFPYVCPICKKSVTRLNTLERHISRAHFQEEIFALDQITPADVKLCKICKSERPSYKTFKEMERSMAEHLGAVHKRLYKVAPESLINELIKLGYKREEHKSVDNLTPPAKNVRDDEEGEDVNVVPQVGRGDGKGEDEEVDVLNDDDDGGRNVKKEVEDLDVGNNAENLKAELNALA